MRTGVSYMGHHNPRHMQTDLKELRALGCDDVFVCLQENDFVWMNGKVDFFAKVAKDNGIRPLAIFWGALNLFGGGRSSQFLLEHPDCHQVKLDGAYNREGCYVNPKSVARIKEMIDRIGALGYDGYFVDEPTHLQCFCASCCAQYKEWYGGNLKQTSEKDAFAFRSRCVINYITTISEHVKKSFPHMETMSCLMECDRVMWAESAKIKTLDNLGSDIYWVNSDRDVEEMAPMVREMGALCKASGKIHHEWLQCWIVKKGKEQRILDQGNILIREKPDSLYVWAYAAQIGTAEACEDVELSWKNACEILKKAKGR
jgi:hypothetical protein